jgi:hypothetical protein
VISFGSHEKAAAKPRQLKVSSSLRAGGIDPMGGNHNRRLLTVKAAVAEHRRRSAETERLLAAADVRIARREHVIERVRRELAA